MAGLDDLLAQIPVADIANKLGAPEGEVSTAIHQLVPALVGGLQVNAENDQGVAGKIANSAEKHAGLLDGGVAVDDVDEDDGDKIVANIFGGNNSDQVASALAGGGAGGGGGDLIKRLLPILAPIVLAYIGKQFSGQATQAEPAAQSGGGGIADVLGSILGGASGGGGNNPLGSILGSVLGGGSGGSNPIGDILGGLLGGKR